MSAALVAPSPDADNRKRRFQQSSGECEEALPKRRYAEARRLLDWVAHLCQRYPLMSDKEITHVLDSCGGDVEAAIRRLDELSLSVAARDAAGAPGDAGQGGGAQADGAAAGHAAAPQPHADAAGAGAPVSAESWVDVVVQEMAASSDLADARARAARLLSAFEAAVRSGAGGAGGDADALRGALDAALRDNAILKRAVAIQNARQQEAAAAAEAQVAELRAALAAQGSQLAAAQLSAYSLSVHLREALGGQEQQRSQAHQPRNPDVF